MRTIALYIFLVFVSHVCVGRAPQNRSRHLTEKTGHHHVESVLDGSDSLSASRTHNEGIIKAWLAKARVDQKLASVILDTGGFACWSVLVQLHLQFLGANALMHKDERDKMVNMCYSKDSAATKHHHHSKHGHHSKAHPNSTLPVGNGVIANRHHNGLGNQLFQYIFSRCAAESLGRDWTSSAIIPSRGETPYNGKGQPPNSEVIHPPNSEIGWAVFKRVFASARLSYSTTRNENETETHVAKVCTPDFRDEGVCRISDRPYDVRLYKKKMLDQMLTAYFSNDCTQGCVYTIGYFQETIYFLPERERILSWMGLGTAAAASPSNTSSASGALQQLQTPASFAHPAGFPALGEEDMSVHVRCCEPAGMCKWLFMPYGYYETILDQNKQDHPDSKVWIITTPQCAKKTMVLTLLKTYEQAELVHAPNLKELEDNVANDFRFLINSHRLLLGKSTFGYWAGYFSPIAKEIHMPVDPRALKKSYTVGEKIPFAYEDARYVHHAWEEGNWFGRVDSTGKLTYSLTDKKVELEQIFPGQKPKEKRRK